MIDQPRYVSIQNKNGKLSITSRDERCVETTVVVDNPKTTTIQDMTNRIGIIVMLNNHYIIEQGYVINTPGLSLLWGYATLGEMVIENHILQITIKVERE